MERSGVTGDGDTTANPKTVVMHEGAIGIVIPVHNRVVQSLHLKTPGLTESLDQLWSEDVEKRMAHCINKGRENGGEFVFLWHNHCLNSPFWKSYQEVYDRILRLDWY